MSVSSRLAQRRNASGSRGGSCNAAVPLAAALALLNGGAAPAVAADALDWQPCGGPFQCASLDVPRNHADPRGPRWQLPLIRLQSSGPGEPLGTIVYNPGGPGLSGVTELRQRPAELEALRSRYDLVSFDLRGTAGSVPAIQCLSAAEQADIQNQVSAPRTPLQITTANRLARMVADRCQEHFSAWLPFVGTRDGARDLDRVREALGEARLNYLGVSYGTYLGAIYAELFPERVGRFVLDGALDPSLPYEPFRRDQAMAMDKALGRFLADCHRRPDCRLPPESGQAIAAIQGVVAGLDARPYQSSDGRQLSGARALGVIQSSMYDPPSAWKPLQQALAAALRGDLEPMLALADGPDLMVNPADTPYLAVMCHDLATNRDPALVPLVAAAWRQVAAVNGASRAWSTLPCAYWPVKAALPPRLLQARGVPPVLVIGTTYDPSTTVGWARALHRQLPDSRLVEWNGDGHLAYGRGGACVDQTVKRFFFEGVLPGQLLRCP